MYIPKAFAENRLEILHDAIQHWKLGTLITFDGVSIFANHIPMVLSPAEGQFGALYGHFAKANPQAHNRHSSVEALAIFHGPNSYISPSYYPGKTEHGKEVPTWNYATVHAYGHLTLFEDPQGLRQLLDHLTEQQEGERPQPWKVSDAPESYIASQLKGIVGFCLSITRIEGKWKMSQNRAEGDRRGVIKGLREEVGREDAQEIAAIMDGGHRTGRREI